MMEKTKSSVNDANDLPLRGANAHLYESLASPGRAANTGEAFDPCASITDSAESQRPAQQPEAEEALKLASLLSVDPHRSRIVIAFPSFHMGLKQAPYEQAKSEHWFQLPKGTYHYRGKTSAMTAFGAVKGIIAALGQIFDIDELQNRLVFATDEQTEALLEEGGYTHYIILGTRSHEYSRQILRQYSEDFEFEFAESAWSIIDKRENKTYMVPDPSRTDPGKPVTAIDYALIEKIVDEDAGRVIIVIGGMLDTGTLAAGNFLIEHREEIYRQFGSRGFQYLLEILPGSTSVRRIIVERSPRLA
jgi:hypothetical protein